MHPKKLEFVQESPAREGKSWSLVPARGEACSLEGDFFHTVLVTDRSGHVVGEAGAQMVMV